MNGCLVVSVLYVDLSDRSEQVRVLAVEHTCNVDSVDMTITPFNNADGFTGFIAVKEQGADAACVFSAIEPGSFQLSLTFDQCGGAENTTTVSAAAPRTPGSLWWCMVFERLGHTVSWCLFIPGVLICGVWAFQALVLLDLRI